MGYIELRNTAIYYQIYGAENKDTIVLVSGLNTQMTRWEATFVKMLADEGFLVICFDNRDCGKSTFTTDRHSDTFNFSLNSFLQDPEKYPPAYSLHDMADDIRDLLQSLNIEKAHIVGRSMGGIIAQLFASRYPAMTQTLTLLMSSSFNPALPKPDDALVRKMTSSSVNFEDNPEAYLKERIDFMKAIYGSRYILNEEKERTLIIEDQVRQSSAVRPYRQIIALISYVFNPGLLTDLQVPALVIHGNEDPLFSIEHAIDLKNNIPGCQLIIKKGMGHAIPQALFPSLVQDISNLIATQYDQGEQS
ncbi:MULTISPECIES: alpha/beta fold hydrolase [Chryseobacterium]|uniref:Pimeloyl-ACP methyl ester carboxylesterase n=1 Tax=Chryseobacterium camelliae TaxID=1265445 RepID=A0ABU0TFG7_9FLAO|nr:MULTISPECIES: alpha/beta hydrolase [Chryseobacterium]MDT3406401.1 pimeloyl-ACP methyl ester carboxylesterase [Pseudacidovorax intermedius]MDQ1095799.1 pimeloyl-ACP methyl ester carboxylesterase [Chryseobacterium camelliae]MDQ1099736.1 pimeloyl-ACP methyl ester carboxylesterase [Chryseobacterium sp. SORGH_AS_1048]MDR6087084.1 pimeloyl-ACP methyl ester carboxylesterase [Chryseobacterium sp. SORGH_AS_0909]MDR6131457.1 pimeloyl-ACP methyl ester carboxylesterase [Chryseobacterium sp. SORGH_AS_11